MKKTNKKKKPAAPAVVQTIIKFGDTNVTSAAFTVKTIDLVVVAIKEKYPSVSQALVSMPNDETWSITWHPKTRRPKLVRAEAVEAINA